MLIFNGCLPSLAVCFGAPIRSLMSLTIMSFCVNFTFLSVEVWFIELVSDTTLVWTFVLFGMHC